jgi:predicted Ser/Thr protein kinase
MADADRCPNCGAERPINAPEGLCPRCLMRNTPGEDMRVLADDGNDVGPGTTAAGPLHEPRAKFPEATAAHTPGPAPPTTDATSDWATGPTGPTGSADGLGAATGLPRGATVRYFGDYEIKHELGRGGMGVVYEARQVSLNRPVALKMVKAGLLAGDDELRRFQNEAEAVALLDHPSVVPVYEVGEHDGQRYFSMKLVPGGSLVPLLDRFKGDPKAAAVLLAETAAAVAHAHMRGILHRDLKPANILVDDHGHPHVTDFGLAKRVKADVELTASGAILGTPGYMAPEQATGRRGSITTATDVYGLGSVLYALLTGKAPFGGESVVETLDAVRNTPPEPPTRTNARVPRDLETICLKCLEKDPQRRYPGAQALADDLRAWLAARPIAARPVGPAARAWLWCRRRPAVAALAAGLIVALISGIAAGGSQWARAERNYRDAMAANADLASADANLRAALAAEQETRRRAIVRFEVALRAIQGHVSTVVVDDRLKEPEFRDLRDKLLGNAVRFYQGLGRDLSAKPGDLGLRQALADATLRAAKLAREVGTTREAMAAYEEAIPLLEALAAELPDVLKPRDRLSEALLSLSRLQRDAGATLQAQATNRKARAVAAAAVAAHPGDPRSEARLAEIDADYATSLSRPDPRALPMDRSFPADPFAR